MPKYISKRTRTHLVTYTRDFDRNDGKGGFAFPCDANGAFEVRREEYQARVAELSGDPAYTDQGVEKHESWVTEPAVIECEGCSSHVRLSGFTNTCECGADYNMSGSVLAPRSQWGEETGESVSDILSVDSDWDYGCP